MKERHIEHWSWFMILPHRNLYMKERHTEHYWIWFMILPHRNLYMKERHTEHYWIWFMILPIAICT